MKKAFLAAAAIVLVACTAGSPAYANPTPESISYTEQVMATVDPVAYTCTTDTGSTYTQYRYYISPTDYISNYEAGTVSCTKLKRK